MKFSIVVPVYGSEKILEGSHREFSRAVGRVTDDYEILFRVDGSPDGSESVLREIEKKDPHVRVFSHSPNRGLGYTLRQLFNDARGEFVVYFDADSFLCFDLSFFRVVFEKIEEAEADAVIVSRYFENPILPFHRWVASEAYYYLNRLLFGVRIRDIGSGFVMFRKSALEAVSGELASDGFEIHLEVFARLDRSGSKILEVPLPYRHWSGGSFNVLKHGPRVVASTLRLWYDLRR